ncbi:anti-sigma factor antagonist [Paracoccus sp. S-4012]|uniref:STAS domain-containing protein n=1 Tax=Paracoccus sp. S-4012 TaxID=2665648 RepID=UPI0012B08C73|nr:STAS domain-containing protein [Paracoccus sp. S-4012]MRX49499.1 anti-sigma factor antagonist [Paracoccus sp. S-4012]
MKLETRLEGEVLHVRVDEARLDAAVATAFKDEMRRVLGASGRTVVLDLSRVDFMDSSGLGATIAVLKSMPRGRSLELDGLRPNVERVFRLTRMDSVFRIRGMAPGSGEGA